MEVGWRKQQLRYPWGGQESKAPTQGGQKGQDGASAMKSLLCFICKVAQLVMRSHKTGGAEMVRSPS